MVRLLDRSTLVNNHTVVALMVFQVIMVLAVSQGDITLFRQQQLLRAVFIDHIPAIVCRGGRTACLMRIQIGYRIPVPERDLTWQR